MAEGAGEGIPRDKTLVPPTISALGAYAPVSSALRERVLTGAFAPVSSALRERVLTGAFAPVSAALKERVLTGAFPAGFGCEAEGRASPRLAIMGAA